MTNLPLGSFKRDEIYTFLGGLYVGLFWILLHPFLKKIEFQNSTETLLGIWLLFFWLNGALLVYFINALCGFAQKLLSEKKIQKLGPVELLQKLKFNITLPIYYSRQVYDELFINTHIDTVVFSSLFLTVFIFFPIKAILFFSAEDCFKGMMFLCLTGLVATILLALFFLIKRQWIEIYALSFLHNTHGELLFYDVNEVAKCAGQYFGNSAIQNFNSKAHFRLFPVITTAISSSYGDVASNAMVSGLNDIVSQMD